MFTGLIETMGHVRSMTTVDDAAVLTIDVDDIAADLQQGESIAINGVCLTVTDHDAHGFAADVMRETLDRSDLAGLTSGSPVNLERALRLDARLGGHIVQGHVDAVSTVLSATAGQRWSVVRLTVPPTIAPLVVEKGSIAVDGVSLTVSAIGDGWFEVSLIPETLAHTTLGTVAPGDAVNLESDILARHVQRLLEFAPQMQQLPYVQQARYVQQPQLSVTRNEA